MPVVPSIVYNYLKSKFETLFAPLSHTHSYAASSHTHTKSQITDFGSYAAASHTHTPASIGAAAESHTHTASTLGALGVPDWANAVSHTNIDSLTATSNGFFTCHTANTKAIAIKASGSSKYVICDHSPADQGVCQVIPCCNGDTIYQILRPDNDKVGTLDSITKAGKFDFVCFVPCK